jgi:hypothetical protein
MKVWNITCECGFDSDFIQLGEAKLEARSHISHNRDNKVFIEYIETAGDIEGNYLQSKTVIVK